MPIYQRRVFSTVKPLEGVNSGDKIFTIAHTGEQFKDENEYRSRCELYEQEVWVCQCTGHTGLTHKEAWDSEHKIRSMLDKHFPEFLHKPILSIVHHSTKPLDALIDEAFNLVHNRFHHGEPVLCLKHEKALGEVIEVTDPENACSSPSSDKENKAGQPPQPNGRFPSMLPLRYTVRLEQSGRVITSLPPSDLSRAERPPSRDLLRLFIRSSAVRQGSSPTAPWVVSAPLFVKHGLKNKIAAIFLPPTERKNSSNTVHPPKKRKLENHKEKPRKKPKTDGTPRNASKGSSPTKAKTAAPPPPKTVPQDSDSDCEVLANIASSSKTKSVLKLKLSPGKNECNSSLSVVLSPLKLSDVAADRDSDDSDDVKLSVLAKSPKKLSFNFSGSPGKKALLGKKGKSSAVLCSSAKLSGTAGGKEKNKKKREKKPKDKEKKLKEKGKASSSKKSDSKTMKQTSLFDLQKKNEKKKRGRPKKGEEKGLKQMSLFDLGKKKPGTPQKKADATPQKSPAKRSPQKPPSLPPCVRKLTREVESGKKINMHNPLLTMCVKALKREHYALIQHEATRELIARRRAKLDEERLLSRMTAEQKEEYLKRKKIEQDEERRAKLNAKRMRFEDQTLQLKPLPKPTLVQTPDGLPNDLFGEVAMVTEFVHAYAGLLMPQGRQEVSAVDLMEALAGRQAHYKLLLDVVTMMLKVLLNDEIAEGYRELWTPLRQIPATPQTAAELVRLALRRADADDQRSEASDAADDGDSIEEELSDGLMARLESCELFELTPAERLEVLRVLVHRLLGSGALAEHLEELEERHRHMWTRKLAIYRDRKAERRREGEQTAAPPPPAPPPPPPPPPPAADASAEGDDLATGTKRARRNLDEARREREQREQEMREKREQHLLQLQKERDEAAVFRDFELASAQHQTVQRRAPLGLDRHHHRYWLLPSLPAALYVETGWARPETLEYRVPPPAGAALASDDDDEQPLKVVQRRAASEREVRERGRVILVSHKQATTPQPGQNMWFCYTSLAEVDQLIASLAEKGERESALRDALTAQYPLISATLPKTVSVPEPSGDGKAPTDGPPGCPGGPCQAGPDKAEVKVESETKTEGKEDTGAGGESQAEAEADADAGGDAKSDSHVKAEAGTEATAAPRADAEETAAPDGRQFLLSTLKEDILGIEEELSEGWLGAVPEAAAWAERVLSAQSVAELADTLLECQRHIGRHALQGLMAPPAGESATGGATNAAAAAAAAAAPSARERRWQEAVRQCRTFSRLHVLVGLLDSSIKWDLSTAKKKCKVCRTKEAGAVSLCGGCKQLYHWACLRPQLQEPPAADWQCPACRPRQQRRLRARKPPADEPLSAAEQENEETHLKKEEVCRVCESPEEEDMIFCTSCPAAFHKHCHDPPVLLRVRPGWACMDCKGAPKKRGGRRATRPLPSELLRAARVSDASDVDDDDDVDEGYVAEGPARDKTSRLRVVSSDEEPAAEEAPAPAGRRSAGRSAAAATAAVQPRRSGRAPRRSYRQLAGGSESEDERRIRALSSDDDDDEAPRRRRRSSMARRVEVRRRCLRAPRKTYVEPDESDVETLEAVVVVSPLPAEAPAEPTRPSPSKVELIQQAGAVCMYCDQPRTHRNELAVCQSCPNLYHRRCASRAGLVDAWQCSVCVMPATYRARPVKPRTSEDYEYDE